MQRKPIEDRLLENAHEMIQKTPWIDADEDERCRERRRSW